MKNKYPIYILSKWRYEDKLRLTVKALERMWIDYNIVVEASEYEEYKKVCKWNVIVLDEKYKEEYDTSDDKWFTISKWSGPARNFIRDHSIKSWFKRHWVIDDNIRKFQLLNNNKKTECLSESFFRPMEDFVDRYENIALAWPYYAMFIPRKYKHNPIILNTRAFSCILIKNDIPLRRRCRYNEDIDLSLRCLKLWYCIVQFRSFLQEKVRTQIMKWGNTDAFYAEYGTSPKSKMLQLLHPDCVRVVFRYWRIHHDVDSSKFKRNKLILRKWINIQEWVNNYWMKTINVKK
jgi:hypothetical protein